MERETPKDGNDVGEALTAPNPVVIRQQKKRDYMRLWRERNRERVRAQQRAAYSRNAPRYIERSTKWRAANRASVNRAARKRRAANPDHFRILKKRQTKASRLRIRLKYRYGLTGEQYEQMVAEQGNACAICGRVPEEGTRLFVDHDHSTGAVRSLLCRNCNYALGCADDMPERLRSMAAYLEAHKAPVRMQA